MPERIALKKLTASDLTFFEWHFRNRNAGNQKSINLNADVFVEQLYPDAPTLSATMDDQIPVALTLLGPGLKGPYSLARKIIKSGSYKNWRLNGEFVHNPDDDPQRFNILTPGDLALIVFNGDRVPTGANVIFVAAQIPEDRALHDRLVRLLPDGLRNSMIRLSRAELESAAAAARVLSAHPVVPFLSDPDFKLDLEDAASGSEEGTQVVKRRSGRRVSAADLAKARQNADRVGRDGEGLVCFFLEKCRAEGKLSSVEWTSDRNAVSPYDFIVATATGENIKIDAKSTEGEFSRAIHISAAEIAEAAQSSERYDLYRVYGIDGDGANLRSTEGIGDFARAVVAGLEKLPKGVRPDSFSVDPAALAWGAELRIERPDEPDDSNA